MKNFFDWLPLLDSLVIGKECWVGRFQELIEIQWIEVEQVHHAHRIGLGLCQQRSQQAAGCDDMVVVCFFFEVLEAVQCFRAFLYFIKDHQSFFRQDLFPCNQGEQLNDPLWIFVCFKNGF